MERQLIYGSRIWKSLNSSKKSSNYVLQKKIGMNKLWIVVLLVSIVAVSSCSDDEDDMPNMNNNNVDECTTEISFAGDIASIISNSCALSGCHVAGFANGDFTSVGGVQSRAGSVSSRVSNGSMPPPGSSAPSLTDAQIMDITCWVSQGAMDN